MTDNNPFKNDEAAEQLERKLSDIHTKEVAGQYTDVAEQHGLKFSDLKKVPISSDAISTIDEETARSGSIAVASKKGSHLIVAVTDPTNEKTLEVIESLKNRKFTVDVIITTPDGLNEAFKRYALLPRKESVELGAIELNDEELAKLEAQIKDIEDLKQKVHTVAVTKVLDTLIAGALKTGASDIHFEPSRESVSIRYRFDGILHAITSLDKSYYEKIVSRVKIVSKMKLNVHGTPQDGRFTIRQKSIDIEVRVSILPSEFGETIVMRLLDPRMIRQELESLGIRDDLLVIIKEQLKKPNGAIITTGPTGSGKTTALYAFVQFLKDSETKIITIEDPIEYHIDGISQTQVDPSKGYTFANGLRAIVRQDPDIILVGEIRDEETADIALNAALTGHLVFTTLHTNDAAGAIPRLIDLDARAEIIAPATNMALAQRLTRKLCPACKKQSAIPKDKFQKIKTALDPIKERFKLGEINEKTIIYEHGGCTECNNSGYKGRIGTFEGFVISKEIEELVLANPTISSVRDLAIKQGMVTMLQDSYMRLLAGMTSLEEIERVVG